MNKLACIVIIILGLITLVAHFGILTYISEPKFDDSHIKEIEDSRGPFVRVCSYSEIYTGGKKSNSAMIFYLIVSSLLMISGTIFLSMLALKKLKIKKRTTNNELINNH